MVSIPVETFPAVIGAATFLIYKLAVYMLCVPRVRNEKILAEDGQDQEANYPISEPAPEPEETHSTPVQQDVAQGTSFRIFRPGLLLLVCFVILYLLQDVPFDGSDFRARDETMEHKSGGKKDMEVDKAAFHPELMKVHAQQGKLTPSANERKKVGADHEAVAVKAEEAKVVKVHDAALQSTSAWHTAAQTEVLEVIHGELLDSLLEETSEPKASRDEAISEAPLIVPVTRLVVGEGTEEEHMRSAYYGTLMVGSPPQLMTVVFDTGSGQVVVPSAYCNSPTCRSKNRYRRSVSRTGKDVNFDGSPAYPGVPRDSMTVNFGTGEVGGVVVEDVVCMKDTGRTGAFNTTAAMMEKRINGLDPGCVKMRFVAATRLSEDPFMDFTFDGIVGLGMDGLSQNRHFNFLHTIGEHMRGLGSNAPSTFGVFLASSRTEVSEIAFGGWTSGHTLEPLSWGGIHDPEAGHWIIPMRGVRVNGRLLDICNDGTCRAAVDTGTSLLSMPSAAFAPIFEGIRHPAPAVGHCVGTGPLLQFDLGHFTIVLGPREYSQVRENRRSRPKPKLKQGPVVDSTTRFDMRCFPVLMAMDFPEPLGPKLFIFGEPILRKYYTVYDAQRQEVGIARAAHRRGPNREELLMRVPEIEGPQKGGRSSPTMFDVFRWRMALRQLKWHL